MGYYVSLLIESSLEIDNTPEVLDKLNAVWTEYKEEFGVNAEPEKFESIVDLFAYFDIELDVWPHGTLWINGYSGKWYKSLEEILKVALEGSENSAIYFAGEEVGDYFGWENNNGKVREVRGELVWKAVK